MTRDAAKQVLAACRPNRLDVHDPELAEAIAMVDRDEQLRKWFEAEQAVDAIIAAKVKAVPVPGDLLSRIQDGIQSRLAQGHPVSLVESGIVTARPESGLGNIGAPEFTRDDLSAEVGLQGKEGDFKVVGYRWRRRVALAMAASLALLGLIAALWFHRPPAASPGSFAAYRADMARFLEEFPRLDIATDRHAEVRAWMQQRHPLTKANLPKALEHFPSIGCRTVDWQGKQLALVCFMVEGQVVHLFVIPEETFPDAGTHSSPVITRISGQTTASWSNHGIHYLLITSADKSLLERLLQDTSRTVEAASVLRRATEGES